MIRGQHNSFNPVHPLSRGLVDAWYFDHPAFTSGVRNSSRRFALFNGATFTPDEEYGILIDGVDDYASVTDDGLLDGFDAITLYVRCKIIDYFSGLRGIVSKRNATNIPFLLRTSVNFGVFNGLNRLVFNFANSNYESSIDVITLNTWQTFAISHVFGDSSSSQFFVDGASVGGTYVSGTGNDLQASNAGPVVIGRDRSNSNTNPLNLQVSHFMIWNRALRVNELQSLYNDPYQIVERVPYAPFVAGAPTTTTYYYRVRAINAAGSSDFSNTDSAEV